MCAARTGIEASSPAVIRVVVAEADRLRREGVARALGDVVAVEVVATVGHGDDVAAAASPDACDVLVLALAMDRCMLLDVATLAARCKVIVVGGHYAPEAVAVKDRVTRAPSSSNLPPSLG